VVPVVVIVTLESESNMLVLSVIASDQIQGSMGSLETRFGTNLLSPIYSMALPLNRAPIQKQDLTLN
jgi:hypothetical protein